MSKIRQSQNRFCSSLSSGCRLLCLCPDNMLNTVFMRPTGGLFGSAPFLHCYCQLVLTVARVKSNFHWNDFWARSRRLCCCWGPMNYAKDSCQASQLLLAWMVGWLVIKSYWPINGFLLFGKGTCSLRALPANYKLINITQTLWNHVKCRQH